MGSAIPPHIGRRVVGLHVRYDSPRLNRVQMPDQVVQHEDSIHTCYCEDKFQPLPSQRMVL
jgi:hypothetical protein